MGLWNNKDQDVLDDWTCVGEIEGGAGEGGLQDTEYKERTSLSDSSGSDSRHS